MTGHGKRYGVTVTKKIGNAVRPQPHEAPLPRAAARRASRPTACPTTTMC